MAQPCGARGKTESGSPLVRPRETRGKAGVSLGMSDGQSTRSGRDADMVRSCMLTRPATLRMALRHHEAQSWPVGGTLVLCESLQGAPPFPWPASGGGGNTQSIARRENVRHRVRRIGWLGRFRPNASPRAEAAKSDSNRRSMPPHPFADRLVAHHPGERLSAAPVFSVSHARAGGGAPLPRPSQAPADTLCGGPRL